MVSGEHNFYANEGSEVASTISKVIFHYGYRHGAFKDDIALIKLNRPLDISGKYIRTACLPTLTDLAGFYNTAECYATGWGDNKGNFILD